ncbi:MAG: helix-hairpin-helix domain-containing protein [Candidatus Omnitrophota bacterium]
MLIALSALAVLGLAVLGYRNYFCRPKFKVISNGLKPIAGDYENIIKRKNEVNINTADANKLQILSGVGPKLAEEIVNYRDSHGLFLLKEDLMKVKGLGPKKFEGMKEYILLE